MADSRGEILLWEKGGRGATKKAHRRWSRLLERGNVGGKLI